MKKIGKIFIIILLVINFLMMGWLTLNTTITNNRVDDLYLLLKREMSTLEDQVANSIIDASLMENIKVINITNKFNGYNSETEMLTGQVEFDITNNEGVDQLYVVMDNLNTGASTRFPAKTTGNLKYTAQIEGERESQYEYYVIGIDEDIIKRVSLKQTIDTAAVLRACVNIHVEECTWSKNVFSSEGIVFFNQDIVTMEKIEVEVTGFYYDDLAPHGVGNSVLLDTIDITDELFSVSQLDYDVDSLDSVEFEKYAFRIASVVNEGTFNEYDYINIMIVFYLEDGTTYRLYQ